MARFLLPFRNLIFSSFDFIFVFCVFAQESFRYLEVLHVGMSCRIKRHVQGIAMTGRVWKITKENGFFQQNTLTLHTKPKKEKEIRQPTRRERKKKDKENKETYKFDGKMAEKKFKQD